MRVRFDFINKITRATIDRYTSILNEIENDTSLRDIIPIVTRCDKLRTFPRFSYSAMTRCDEKDEYKKEYGKDIAESKACLKYHKAMIKDYEFLIKRFEFYIKKFNEHVEKHKEKCTNIENSLKRYM